MSSTAAEPAAAAWVYVPNEPYGDLTRAVEELAKKRNEVTDPALVDTAEEEFVRALIALYDERLAKRGTPLYRPYELEFLRDDVVSDWILHGGFYNAEIAHCRLTPSMLVGHMHHVDESDVEKRTTMALAQCLYSAAMQHDDVKLLQFTLDCAPLRAYAPAFKEVAHKLRDSFIEGVVPYGSFFGQDTWPNGKSLEKWQRQSEDGDVPCMLPVNVIEEVCKRLRGKITLQADFAMFMVRLSEIFDAIDGGDEMWVPWHERHVNDEHARRVCVALDAVIRNLPPDMCRQYTAYMGPSSHMVCAFIPMYYKRWAGICARWAPGHELAAPHTFTQSSSSDDDERKLVIDETTTATTAAVKHSPKRCNHAPTSPERKRCCSASV